MRLGNGLLALGVLGVTAGEEHETVSKLAFHPWDVRLRSGLCCSPTFGAVATASDTFRGLYQTLLYNMQHGPNLGQQGRVGGDKNFRDMIERLVHALRIEWVDDDGSATLEVFSGHAVPVAAIVWCSTRQEPRSHRLLTEALPNRERANTSADQGDAGKSSLYRATVRESAWDVATVAGRQAASHAQPNASNLTLSTEPAIAPRAPVNPLFMPSMPGSLAPGGVRFRRAVP